MDVNINDILYRYVDSSLQRKPLLEKYRVIKETECGFWIELVWIEDEVINFSGKKKWKSKYTLRRFVNTNTEEALISYYWRKYSQIKILNRELNTAKDRLEWLINNKPYIRDFEINDPYKKGFIEKDEMIF